MAGRTRDERARLATVVARVPAIARFRKPKALTVRRERYSLGGQAVARLTSGSAVVTWSSRLFHELFVATAAA